MNEENSRTRMKEIRQRLKALKAERDKLIEERELLQNQSDTRRADEREGND